jgi:plasmid maintenance system antidote protein VapI
MIEHQDVMQEAARRLGVEDDAITKLVRGVRG